MSFTVDRRAWGFGHVCELQEMCAPSRVCLYTCVQGDACWRAHLAPSSYLTLCIASLWGNSLGNKWGFACVGATGACDTVG